MGLGFRSSHQRSDKRRCWTEETEKVYRAGGMEENKVMMVSRKPKKNY